MGNASSTAKVKVTSQDKAILQLKLQRDKLNRAQLKIATVVRREEQIARECLTKDKDRAKLALRKKKYQESMLKRVQSQADTLEQLIDTIEFKLIEKDVLYGLEQGNQVLKELNKETSIEKVERILDDTEEGVRYQQEVSDMLGSVMTQSEEFEVEEELERMEREMTAEKLAQAPPVLPNVPQTKPEESEELEEPTEEAKEDTSKTDLQPVTA